MRVLHATPARNVNSILKAGLLTAKSQGKLAAVWVVSRGKAAWSVLHVLKRHGGRAETILLLDLDIPRRWLRRGRNKGLWYTTRDVPPSRIRRVVSFMELAGAGTEA